MHAAADRYSDNQDHKRSHAAPPVLLRRRHNSPSARERHPIALTQTMAPIVSMIASSAFSVAVLPTAIASAAW